MERNEHIVDLVDAVEARLTSLCPLLAAVSRSQATSYDQLAALTTRLQLLPAAVVVLGTMETEAEAAAHAIDYREVNLGILLVGDYTATEDAGTADFWAALDQVHDAFTPTVDRDEDERLPVAVLGDQSGANRGTLLIPAGFEPVETGHSRCAGLYRLLCLDTIADRTGTPTEPAEPAAPETGVETLADADRFTVWVAPGLTRMFALWSTIKAVLKAYFDTLYDALGAASTVQGYALTPAEASPSVSSPYAVPYSVTQQVQDLGTVSTALTLTKGTGWPASGTFAYVLLTMTLSGTPTVTWTVADYWTTDAPSADGTYLVHLRQIGGSIYASAEEVQT